MLAKTHLHIANFAIDQVKGKGIYLNDRLFKIGSVLPDYSPYHKYVRHYREESQKYVEDTLNSLVGSSNINEISFKAGIASHYLADYFCYPHFNNMALTTKDALEHLRYEYMLDKEVEKLLGKQGHIKEYSFDDIQSILTKHTEIYKNNKQFIEDINLSLSVIINTLGNLEKWELAYA